MDQRNRPPLPLSASWLAHRTHSLFAIGSRCQPLPSHWSSWSCCLVTSEACIFEQSSGCLLQHFFFTECSLRHPHWLTHTHSRTHTHTHTSHNAPRRYPGFAARPAGTDSDTSKCSTGITFPLDTRLSYRPTRYWQTRHLKGGETESWNRTSLSAGYCSYRRRVKRLTSEKKKETGIVLRLVKSQADFSAGFEKYKTDRTFNNLCVSLLTALGRRGRHSRENWQKHPFTYWNTCRLDPLA